MDDVSEPDWKRVGDLLQRRLKELTWTQDQLAQAAGVTTEAIRPLLQGRPNTSQFRFMADRGARTRTKVALAVNWSWDSIDRVLIGEDPILSHGAEEEGSSLDDRVSRLEQQMAEILAILRDAGAGR